MNRQCKLAVIGVGAWGKNIVATCQTLPQVSLVGVVSKKSRADLAVSDTCQVYSDVSTLLQEQSEKLDGAIIATPPSTHVPIALELIQHNLPLMIEKPLSLHLNEANNLLEAAKFQNQFVLVDHIHLFHPGFIKLLDYLPKIGKLKSIKMEAGNYGPFRKDATVLWDWAPHDLAMCLQILGNDFTITSSELFGEQNKGHVKIQATSAVCESVEIVISNILKTKVRTVVVEGEYGSLHYDGLNQPYLRYLDKKLDNTQLKDIELVKTSPLENAITEFSNQIAFESQSLESLILAVRVVELITQIEQRLSVRKMNHEYIAD